MVLEKTLENPLGWKEIKPVNPKGNQPWIFTGRTDDAASIFWPPDVKSWLIRKDPDAGKDWRQEEKGMTENKMVGWHHWLYRHEFEQALREWWGTGTPGMVQYMGLQESDMTEHLNNNSLGWNSSTVKADWVIWVDDLLDPCKTGNMVLCKWRFKDFHWSTQMFFICQ